MKYDRTCSASGMFVANDVSFNEIWRKSLYNFRQRVTQSNNIIVKHVFHFTRATSKIWNNCDRILCKYVIIMCMCIGHIHLLAIICSFFYITMSECMIFYGPTVPEINYSSSSSKKNVRCTSTRKEMKRKTANLVERLV